MHFRSLRSLRQKGTGSRQIIALFVALAMVLSGGGFAQARTVGEISEDISRLSEQEQQIQSQIDDLEGKLDTKRTEIRSLENDIAILQAEIDQLQLQIESTQVKIDRMNAEIEKTQIEIRITEKQIEKTKLNLGALVRLLHSLDGENPFAILVANKNFSEILDQVQYTQRIQGRTQENLDLIQQLRHDLEVQKADLEDQLTQAQALQAQLNSEKVAIGEKRSQKDEILKTTEGEEANYQNILADKKAASEQIESQINSLEQELKDSGQFVTPPAVGSGVFIMPVNGVVTQRYGSTDFSHNYNSNMHNGIDISGPIGSPLFAAADGVVVGMGSLEGAYGNWVAIKHNSLGGIVSLYGHMAASAYVGVGSSVVQGDVIGTQGNTGFSFGDHVHFTVFVVFKVSGSIPYGQHIDPAPYLGI